MKVFRIQIGNKKYIFCIKFFSFFSQKYFNSHVDVGIDVKNINSIVIMVSNFIQNLWKEDIWFFSGLTCQATEGCEGWNWGTETFGCDLWSDSSIISDNIFHYSKIYWGTKNCPPPTTTTPAHTTTLLDTTTPAPTPTPAHTTTLPDTTAPDYGKYYLTCYSKILLKGGKSLDLYQMVSLV